MRASTMIVIVALAASGAGCFASHAGEDPGMPPPVMPPVMPPPSVVPPPSPYEVGPAPGEGSSCPSLDDRPADCGGGDGLCDVMALRRALAAARSGDVVRVGRCRVRGSLSVPMGVILAGVDRDASVVSAPAGRSAIVVSAHSSPTVVRCLTAVANEAPGVVVEGTGEARAEHLTVLADTGVGLRATGVGRLALHGLDLVGPVTSANADAQPLDPTPEEVGTYGLELTGVGEVTIYGTSITGFALAGLLAAESDVTLRATELSENLGAGAMFVGGQACVRGLTSERSLQGTRLIPAYGLVFTSGAEVHGADVSVIESEGYGILQDDSHLDVETLVLEGNRSGGLWAQGGGETRVAGEGNRIVDNGFAGVRVCGASAVSISDAEISGSRRMTRIVGTRPVEIGAGLLLGDSAHIHLENLRLDENDTVGVVVDLGASATYEIVDVYVSGRGEAFGALAHDDVGWLEGGGWDDGITREGAVEINDAVGAAGWPDVETLRCVAVSP